MKTSKEKYIAWFEENYIKLLSVAANFVNKNIAGDLINDLYIYFKEKETINDNIIEEKKEFLYTFISMRQYAFNKHSKFNQKILDIHLIKIYLKELDSDDELKIENNKEYMKIYDLVNKLYSEKKITWYQYKLFKLYYFTEYEYSIEEMDKNEVDKLRKISLRNLQDKTDINYVSISNSINKTLEIIKKHLTI